MLQVAIWGLNKCLCLAFSYGTLFKKPDFGYPLRPLYRKITIKSEILPIQA